MNVGSQSSCQSPTVNNNVPSPKTGNGNCSDESNSFSRPPKRRKKNKKSDYVEYAWLILIASAVMQLGDFYAFDLGYSIKADFRAHFSQKLNEDEFQTFFSLFYSAYELPNLVLPLFTGLLVDKYGYVKPLAGIAFLVTLGNLFVFIGSEQVNPWMMTFGRVVYGLGGESLATVQWVLVASYFLPQQMGLIFGFTTAITNVATAMTYHFSPIFSERSGVNTAFFVGFAFCAVSFLVSFVVIYMETKVKSLTTKVWLDDFESHAFADTEKESPSTTGSKETDFYSIMVSPLRRQRSEAPRLIPLEDTNFSTTTASNLEQNLIEVQPVIEEELEPWLFTLPKEYWELFGYFLFTNISFVCLYYSSIDLINELWLGGNNTKEAEKMNATANIINQFILCFGGLFLGWFCGAYRLIRCFGYGAVLLYLVGIFMLPIISPIYVSFGICQLAQTMMGVHVWLKNSLVVSEKKLGLATGLLYINYNLAVAAVPLINDYLSKVCGDHQMSLLILSSFVLLTPFLNSRLTYKA